VTTSTRSLPQLAQLRLAVLRRAALVLVSLVSLSATLLLGAAPAGAIVTTVGAKVGLQPRSTSLFVGAGAGPESFANPSGGPVLASNKTYAIYWDPTDHYHGDWQGVIDGFFHNMGAASGSLASVFSVDTQYTDAVNQHAAYSSTFMGAYTDTDRYPTVGNCTDPHPLAGENFPKKEPDAITCLTNAQIQHELEVFVAGHGLQKGMSTIFYLLTPPGVTVCLDNGGPAGHCSDFVGTIAEIEKDEKEAIATPESYKNSFCSYHSDISPTNEVIGDERTILYATVPWIAGGFGDGHLAPVDQTTGYECQDGGFNPASKPIEEKEKVKSHTKLEEEEFEKKTPKEKREQEEAEALELEKPHEQEPNQVPCPSPDGTCDTGLADLIINQIGVEQQNIVTNPLLNAWQDSSGKEATDECRDFFAPTLGGSATASPETFAGTLFNQTLGGGDYYLNNAFNLAALKLPYPAIPCMHDVGLEPKFTAPNPVNSGEVVGFDGMESDITLNGGTAYSGSFLTPSPKPTYAKYKWNFGDGSPEVTGFAPGASTLNSPETSPCAAPWESPCAASTFHSYQYGGTYNVTLTVTDTGGNTASVTNLITVVGPAPPSPPVTPSGGGSSAGSATPGTAATGGASSPATTGGASGAGSTAKTVPGPVAKTAVVTKSLSKVLRSGLVVSYSVNEQVAGQFQVLLASSIAHKIGLHGAPATGLPKGTPPQIVIAKAILITTKGGHNTVKIQFGKNTAAKLRKLHSVSLMIRLVVRGASHSPATTTVISTVKLSH
jgi:hypothetical protein